LTGAAYPSAPRPGSLHVLVMAKAPMPGKVKTRLCPPCSPQQAAALAEAALADTIEAAMACSADRVVVALDGAPGPWLPAGVEVIAQRGEGLALRLANAWADTGAGAGADTDAGCRAGWGIQIGMDTPQVTGALLDSVLDALVAHPEVTIEPRTGPGPRPRAVLGPALDGGWWVIALPGTDPHQVFPGVPMSTSGTYIAQRRRLRGLGLDVVRAPLLRDIDTIDDLRAVAGAPGAAGEVGAVVGGRVRPGRTEWTARHILGIMDGPASDGGAA
jgi:glycosyltransferase A (GT-A) superfamily protein (DUF2064 family)